MNAVSLFAGVGGFDLALQRAGIEVVAAVELDPAARGVLADRFPDVTLFPDVREVTGADLVAAGFVPDRGVITAGWPCQGNSVAGRRGGMADPRSGLWSQVVRLLAETCSRWFIGENVPGLYSVNDGRDIAVVRSDLAQLGYWWAERILDAQHFGVPQRRRRIFFVGCAGDGAAPVQVLLEPEGGERDSASGGAPWAGVAGVAALSASNGGADDNDATGGRLIALSLTTRQQRNEPGQTYLPVAFDAAQITSPESRSNPQPGDPSMSLAATGRAMVADLYNGSVSGDITQTLSTASTIHSIPHVAHSLTGEGFDASEDGTGRGTPLVAWTVSNDSSPVVTREAIGALKVGTGLDIPSAPMVWQGGSAQDQILEAGAVVPTLAHSSNAHGGHNQPKVMTPSAVRRLTPVECERLQGFPDGWTAISNGQPQSDSARYRQLGNAVAVPVVEWIARRLATLEAK